LAKYEINIIELGGELVKLSSLIQRAFTNNLIRYRIINFHPYPPNVNPPKTNFFNLFLGFLAKPAKEINTKIMNPILWHVKYVICNGNEELNKYIWNWWAFLVQRPEKKPRSILVLKSALQQCGKNIITDFIGDKVLGPNLHYATSDLGKILGKFNSLIQGKKLVVMNETSMSSGEWHRFNGHLKSLITEGRVSIERKGLEPLRLNDFSGFMITSNQDTPIKIDAGDARVVCFDVSPRCRGNIPYFDRLGKILDHFDAPGVVMSYLLSRDLSKWSPQNFPITKMKTDTIMKQLPNPIRFIIQHIKSWPKNQIEKPICGNLYQDYLTWCGNDGEDRISNNKFGGFLPLIGIEKKQVRINGKREWVYILDRSKIVAKLRESVGDIEEFSDTPQTETSSNESTNIPIFDVPKIITPEPEKIDPIPLTTDHIKKGKNVSPAPPITNLTQDLFDSITNESSVASSSKSADIPMTPEIECVEPVDDKPEPPEIIEESEIRGYTSSSNEEWAIDHGEDPDMFMTITEKDEDLSRIYRDRLCSDADMIQFAKDTNDDPNTLMDMSRRERFISEEIALRTFEDDGEYRVSSYDDEEWKEKIAILQENGYLCINKMNDQELETPEKVLNLLTARMINLNGPTFRKLIRNGYRYVNDLSNYSEIFEHIDYDYPEHTSFLFNIWKPAIIPPLDILQSRPDIYRKYLVTVESCQNLFG
ncbi:2348_t:CDS:2, partial [Entrophospora sp. SA101]